MALERKPLFSQRLVAERLTSFTVPDLDAKKLPVIRRWRTTLDRGRLQRIKETELQGQFLGDFFRTVLGYTGLSEGADSWTYGQEETVQVDGECADGVLGHFTDEHKTHVAAIELKGADTRLDTRPSGRRLTPVQQCYHYATNLECNWIVVSNYRELRLYHKSRSEQHYELFRLEDLCDPDELRRFCFLLCADHVVARKGASVIDRLLEETGEEEETTPPCDTCGFSVVEIACARHPFRPLALLRLRVRSPDKLNSRQRLPRPAHQFADMQKSDPVSLRRQRRAVKDHLPRPVTQSSEDVLCLLLMHARVDVWLRWNSAMRTLSRSYKCSCSCLSSPAMLRLLSPVLLGRWQRLGWLGFPWLGTVDDATLGSATSPYRDPPGDAPQQRRGRRQSRAATGQARARMCQWPPKLRLPVSWRTPRCVPGTPLARLDTRPMRF